MPRPECHGRGSAPEKAEGRAAHFYRVADESRVLQLSWSQEVAVSAVESAGQKSRGWYWELGLEFLGLGAQLDQQTASNIRVY